MAMSVGSDGGEEKPMSDINTTPLVDVMLVLLIIFLIAVPVVVQTIDLQLPKVAFEPTTTKPENVSLSVNVASDGVSDLIAGSSSAAEAVGGTVGGAEVGFGFYYHA